MAARCDCGAQLTRRQATPARSKMAAKTGAAAAMAGLGLAALAMSSVPLVAAQQAQPNPCVVPARLESDMPS